MPYGITGLNVFIDIVNIDTDNLIVDNGICTELITLHGVYIYDFILYDNTKNYSWKSDCGIAYEDEIRYIYGASECDYNKQVDDVQTDIAFLKDIEGGRWKIEGNQMIFYKADNATEIARFNLKDINSNPTDRNVFERVRV